MLKKTNMNVGLFIYPCDSQDLKCFCVCNYSLFFDLLKVKALYISRAVQGMFLRFVFENILLANGQCDCDISELLSELFRICLL